MSRASVGTGTALWVLLLVGPANADEQAAARAIVDKAIQAMGGEERMTRFPALSWKAKSIVYGPGVEISMTEEGHAHGNDRLRLDVAQGVGGTVTLAQVQILNGDDGWVQTQGRTVPLPKNLVS